MNKNVLKAIYALPALILIAILSSYLFWNLSNPSLLNLESSLKFEADQFNSESKGHDLGGGLRYGPASASGNTITIVINDINGIIDSNEKGNVKRLLTPGLCTHLLNIRNPYARHANLVFKFENKKRESSFNISINSTYCSELGYRPVTG